MTLQQTSSLSPNKPVDSPDISHSQKRLHRLTKAAVDRAYMLHTESRRLVHIVETEACGSSNRLGLSNPFRSLSSVLLKNSPSKSPPRSRNWALSKESSDRRSVTARIHTLLLQWRADSSLKWRSRVASVVPVLEEALYKEAKSKEEYTNPELLESHLMHVLCHFEAGNGPFLLQGSSPLYPLRNLYPPRSSSDGMSALCQCASTQGASANEKSHEIASEETYERAGLPCTESSASGSHPNLTEVHSNSWEIIDSGQRIAKEGISQKHGGHRGKKFVRKVADMLAKKRMENSEPGRTNEDGEKVERISVDAEMGGASRAEINRDGISGDPFPTNHEILCNGEERRKRTLGGMLGLNMFGNSVMENSRVANAEGSPLASSTTKETTCDNTPVFNAEEAPFSLSTTGETSQDMIYNLVADAMEPCCILDSQAEEVITLPLPSSLLVGSQSVDNEASNVSNEVGLECSETGEFLTHGANCACRPLSHPCFPFSSSASKPSPSPSLSSSSSSGSPPFMSHQTPLSSPSPSSLSSGPPPFISHPTPPSSPSSSLSSTSSSPSQQQLAHRSTVCLTPLPQHQSPSFSRQHHKLVPLSTSSDVSSAELNHACRLENPSQAPSDGNEMNVLPQSRPMASWGATELVTQVASGQPTTQAASEQNTEGERRASSSNSSPSAASDEVLPRTRERGVKVPLRSFLAEREELCVSRYEEGGLWETWEEVTEQLDGMCCVCMVGFKGAAFIPCGHTFCRKCSRELWRGRGTCPLCNRYIRDILDIY